MIDIIAFLKSVINSYSEDITFVHGAEDEANINLNSVKGEVVYFERPYTLRGQITGSGIVHGNFKLNLFFLNSNQYHDEGTSAVNGYQEAVDTLAIKPALDSAATFIAALRSDGRIVDVSEFDFIDITDFPEFDNNMSGGLLTVGFAIRNAGNVCARPRLPEEE